jgi:hypothetical protein
MEKIDFGSEIVCTSFAPAERSPAGVIKEQVDLVATMEGLKQVVSLMPDIVLILNSNRQIVYANKTAMALFEQDVLDSVYGLRSGELIDCDHAFDAPGGCGTTVYCSACGAVKAILSGLRGEESVEECRVTRKKKGDSFDFRVWSFPVEYEHQPFVLFVMNDISNEKRRRILERIFFHDVVDTAGGIHNFSEILLEATPSELTEFKEIIFRLSNQLVDDILAQKQLLSAESNELAAQPVTLNSLGILKEVIEVYTTHDVVKGKKLVIDPQAAEVEIKNDRALLSRVLGNMTKNALEASESGQTVTLGCETIEGDIQFWVHNQAVIPEDVQLQIFQRSFSTKGLNRGLGTYSMRLLSERYLKGKVAFTSSEKEGTRFTARYSVNIGV